MNVNLQSMGGMSVWNRMTGGGLKSTKQKMQRQEKCTEQVAFLENQKSNLKNMQCDSLEEIAHKLEMYHTYEDQIAAVKKEYNNSQMMHALDEARERGEKIAQEAEKTEPKSAEERRKDMQEEALGTDESKGILTEIMEEISETLEENAAEILEEAQEEALEKTQELQEASSEEYANQDLQEASLTEQAEQGLPVSL